MVSSFHSHRGFSPVLTKKPNLEPFQRFSKVRDMKTVKTVPSGVVGIQHRAEATV
jgi:hypothetical protein